MICELRQKIIKKIICRVTWLFQLKFILSEINNIRKNKNRYYIFFPFKAFWIETIKKRRRQNVAWKKTRYQNTTWYRRCLICLRNRVYFYACSNVINEANASPYQYNSASSITKKYSLDTNKHFNIWEIDQI